MIGGLLRRLRTRLAAPAQPAPLPDGAQLSFATHGEDLIARELLLRAHCLPDTGFYVDVGAYHPWLASNTAWWYRQGWSGIAVEPNPSMVARFREERPRDVVVQAAIAAAPGTATLYSFGEWASSNTLDPEWADSVVRTQHVEIQERIEVPATTLAAVLDQHLPPGTTIDLLNVDVEGLDLVALESNDWERYRPVLVAVEEYGMDLSDLQASDIARFMGAQGYRLVTRAVLTNFYLRDA